MSRPSVADNVDGELARARHATSSHGKWIERAAHDYGERALILGAAIGGHAKGHQLWWLVAPLALLIFEVYLELLRLNNDRRRHRARPAAPRDSGDEDGPRANLARRLLQSSWVFHFRPVSTNLWIVVGLFHLVYETLLLTTALRVLGALGFLASHLLRSRRRSSPDRTS